MINKEKIKKIFIKNYDYYFILILITISLIMSSLNYYELNMGKDAKGLFFSIPCFIRGQEEFINKATFNFVYYLKFNLLFNGKVLMIFLSEKILSSVLVFGPYFLGKNLFVRYDIRLFKSILKILLFIYLVIVFDAAVINPIVRCMFKIG